MCNQTDGHLSLPFLYTSRNPPIFPIFFFFTSTLRLLWSVSLPLLSMLAKLKQRFRSPSSSSSSSLGRTTITSTTVCPRLQHSPSPVMIPPEILEQILSYLDQKALRNVAARVCRYWFYISKTLFRHHVLLTRMHVRKPRRRDNIRKRLFESDRFTIMREFEPCWNDKPPLMCYDSEPDNWVNTTFPLVHDALMNNKFEREFLKRVSTNKKKRKK